MTLEATGVSWRVGGGALIVDDLDVSLQPEVRWGGFSAPTVRGGNRRC